MHCVKSFSSPYFPVFGSEKTPYLDSFQAVVLTEMRHLYISLNKIIYLFKKYLSDSTHRKSYSTFSDLLIGVPQGSILGSLLFNVCIYNLFFFTEDETLTSHTDILLLSLTELMYSQFLNGSRYSRMDQVKFVEEKL